jgi:hypothetical protein
MTAEEIKARAIEAVFNEHGNYNEDTKRAAEIAAEAIIAALGLKPASQEQHA